MKFFNKFLALGVLLGSVAVLTPAFAAFDDVDSNDPYGPAILHLQQEGIVQGFADGTYRSQTNITRAEYTKILLYAKFGEELVTQCDAESFPDVEQSAWYYNVICYAKDESIVAGYGDGTFRPNDSISYAEAAKILVNVMIAPTEESDADEWWTPYTDLLEAHGALPPTVGVATNPLSRGEMAFMTSTVMRSTVADFIEAEFENKLVYLLNPGTTVEELQNHCAVEGGTFDECGSPCAPDAEVCAEVCAYTCTEIPDDSTFIRERFETKLVYETGDGVTEAELRNHCALEGGTFNTCGSVCDVDAEACIEMCAMTCEGIPAHSQDDDEDMDDEDDEAEETTWQTYTDYSLGFRIDYPETMTVEELSNETIGAHVQFMVTGEDQEPATEITDGASLTIDHVTLETDQTLSAYVDAQIEDTEAIGEITMEKEAYTLAGKEGFRFAANTLGEITHIYLPTEDGEALAISYNVADPNENGYQDWIDQMLDSLEIIAWNVETFGATELTIAYPNNPVFDVETDADSVAITHAVPYEHADVCDAVGTGATLAELTDFDVQVTAHEQDLAATVEALEPEGFVDDHMTANGESLIAEEGFIDEVTYGDLSGWRITSGAEGCGEYRYYFPIEDELTVTVSRAFVPEYSGINANRDEALAVEGAILPEENDLVFEAIIESINTETTTQ